MKKIYLCLFIATIITLFTNCGIHSGLTLNLNNHNTEVVLSQANYVVIKSIQGSSSAKYFLGIGGVRKKALISEARAQMLRDQDILGSSRAVINETVETHRAFAFFFTSYTVTVSAHLIEFKKGN
jgi:hypothetical protein